MSDEFYNEKRNESRDYSDRYRSCKVLEDTDTGELLLSTRENVEIPYHSNDKYHRVTSNEVTRLDIIAAEYYRNPLFWWIIAQANGITDPLTRIPPGTLLRIPAVETLYGNNGVLL